MKKTQDYLRKCLRDTSFVGKRIDFFFSHRQSRLGWNTESTRIKSLPDKSGEEQILVIAGLLWEDLSIDLRAPQYHGCSSRICSWQLNNRTWKGPIVTWKINKTKPVMFCHRYLHRMTPVNSKQSRFFMDTCWNIP